eukprot:m.242792 g.242792  ORF g.242792 m.242792 type:complete len:262 (-) comp26228_c0_seq1:19-804(-)
MADGFSFSVRSATLHEAPRNKMPSSATKTSSRGSPARGAAAVQGKASSSSSQASTTKSVRKPATSAPSPAKGAVKKLEGDKKSKSQEAAPSAAPAEAVVTTESEPAPAAPAEPPREWSTVVTYSHYKTAFPTRGGRMRWADIDEQYSISFVFKGNFTTTLVGPDATRHPRDAEGNFEGLREGATYALEVEADPTIPIVSKPLRLVRREDVELGVGAGQARKGRVDDITQQLKNMSADELREQGADYKRLLEERELEDMLAS